MPFVRLGHVGAVVATIAFAAAASAEPVPAPDTESRVFGDWTYRCARIPGADTGERTLCEVAQEMAVQEDGRPLPVLTLALAPGPDGSAEYRLTAVAPLGLRLAPGLSIAVDGGETAAFDFLYCDARGCWVEAPANEDLVARFKAGRTGQARYVLLDGRGLTIEFSLAGFTAALAALDAGLVAGPRTATE